MSKPCKVCSEPLSGKQRDFCSPKCNTKWRRKTRARREEHLSITAAAVELGVSRHVIYRAIRSGRLQAIQVPTAGRARLEVTRGSLEGFRAGRQARRRPLSSMDVDAAIRQAVGEMVRRVQAVARRCAK